jgi:hypothetical protein
MDYVKRKSLLTVSTETSLIVPYEYVEEYVTETMFRDRLLSQ